jgi:hypothetical protein
MKCKKFTFVAAITACILSSGALTGTALASDNQGTHVCLSNATASCLDLYNDSFTDHTYLWMYDSSGNGLGWKVTKVGNVGANSPFVSGSGLNTKYQGDPIYVIYKTKGSYTTNDCVNAPSFGTENFQIFLKVPCQAIGTDYLNEWVHTAYNYLVNIGATNQSYNHGGNLTLDMAADGAANKSNVYEDTDGNSGLWYKWTFK